MGAYFTISLVKHSHLKNKYYLLINIVHLKHGCILYYQLSQAFTLKQKQILLTKYGILKTYLSYEKSKRYVM